MIRDGGILGRNIAIFEALSVAGGSLDGGGNPIDGYTLRGGRMLTTDTYECTWSLFKSLPSLTTPRETVFSETIEFNAQNHSHARARLVDRHCAKLEVEPMGFSMHDRGERFKLAEADEDALDTSRITDWLSPPFFATNFWFMWATTFAFQPWHSAVEFRRYLHRFMLEFSRIGTLAGVKRTDYNQYDSLVRPLVHWLATRGVNRVTGCAVTDIDLDTVNGKTVVTGLQITRARRTETITVGERKLVFFQNGSMTDASSVGSMTRAPGQVTKDDSGGWALWEKLAKGRPDFGHPAVFSSNIAESFWESFTITLKRPTFFQAMEDFTGNRAGTGGLVTFKDLNWLMSIVLAHQPHFIDQPADIQVCWGYALHPDRVGNFVAEAMVDCTGEEILHELCGHLNFDLDTVASANRIPCRMPYITRMFMPRAVTDRPRPVPKSSKNLAFVSQFVKTPSEVVFTVEVFGACSTNGGV